MKSKPIVAFLGLAHSGKSTTATAIGKILFGGNFKGGTMPHDARSLKQVMGEHYYYEIDNLDDRVPRDICDVLAGTSTGAGSEERTLGENVGSVFIDTHCFVVITSREPKFKRPDVVDRLLVFRMGKIEKEKVKSPTWMERTLLEHRQAIWEEIISNLNTIVFMLNWWRDWEKAQGPDYEPPGNIFRIADYEEFGKKISGLSARLQFWMALEAMETEKAVMTVEEDYVFQVIHFIATEMAPHDRSAELAEVSGSQLYARMREAAKVMELEDFQDRYPSAMSVVQHLPHIVEAMGEQLYVDIRTKGTGSNAKKAYTFLRLEQWPVRLPKPYADELGLIAGREYYPAVVLEKLKELDPTVVVAVQDLIRAFGVGRKRGA